MKKTNTCNLYQKYLDLNKRIKIEKGIDLTSTEFKFLNETVSNEIKNGYSFSMIIRNHKNEFPVGKRALYNYVEKGYYLDLPRKVRYKKRVRNINAIKTLNSSKLLCLEVVIEK